MSKIERAFNLNRKHVYLYVRGLNKHDYKRITDDNELDLCQDDFDKIGIVVHNNHVINKLDLYNESTNDNIRPLDDEEIFVFLNAPRQLCHVMIFKMGGTVLDLYTYDLSDMNDILVSASDAWASTETVLSINYIRNSIHRELNIILNHFGSDEDYADENVQELRTRMTIIRSILKINKAGVPNV